jgi:mRNA interferase MazF
LSNTDPPLPRRGEVWIVDFDPTRGAEIRKKRPSVVVSSDSIGKLPIKIVVPITEWKDLFERNLWHVKIEPSKSNGLSKTSALDALQVRGIDTERFIRKVGRLTSMEMDDLAAAIAAVVEYQ